MDKSLTLRYHKSDEGVDRKTLTQVIIMKVTWGKHRQILVPAAAVIRVVQVLFLLTRRKGYVGGKLNLIFSRFLYFFSRVI
jgi:hypothetical protein